MVDLKNQFNVGTAAAVAAVTNRKEQQEAEVAEARIAKAEADDLLACASQPVGMDLDDLELVGDEVLQNVGPSTPKSTEKGEVAQWGEVVRDTARKQVEVIGKLFAATRARTSDCG